jgi:hypothetical protein
MSSSAAAARPLARPVVRPAPGARPRPPAPRLKVVAPARSGSRTGLALLAVALLAGGLITLLLLNISLSRGSYQLSDAQGEQRKLTERQQALEEEIEAARAPQHLAARARDLGMVPAPNTAFVELPSGKVRGKPAEAEAPPAPKPKATAEKGEKGRKTDRKPATTTAERGAARTP